MSKWTRICPVCCEIFWSDKLLKAHQEKRKHGEYRDIIRTPQRKVSDG